MALTPVTPSRIYYLEVDVLLLLIFFFFFFFPFFFLLLLLMENVGRRRGR